VNHRSRILVAVDFSKPACDAFDYALALSAHHGAELVALQAVPTDQPVSWHARARMTLSQRLRRKAQRAGVAFTERVQRGDPAEIILLHARSLQPDAIVIGTHQRRGFDRLRHGSVAERVAAKATVPVLLVPPQHGRPSRPLNHAAVAIDFGPGTERVLEHASLAAGPAGAITLIHVVPRSASAVPEHLYGYGIPESEEPVVRDAQQRLEALAARLKDRTSATVATRVLIGEPSTEIKTVVDSSAVDVLVVAVSTRGRVSRALFGTTGARLVRASRVPVLAVPISGAAVPAADATPLVDVPFAGDEKPALPVAA
jgi:nucleotide-binding universal stress UspA family protein